MVRSMLSGVTGLRGHQTRMDTIGNNIANVNTYGFKSGRTTFRDIYYQGMKTASEPTAAQGGMNPSSVGYGSQVGSVDLMMGRSSFTMTDQTMDLAIDGDGFFQVQDNAGNIYYTRAGMLNFDSAGNLVDMQGNFVLGVNGDPTGRNPSSERISVSLPPVNPTPASVVQQINGLEWTISATNPTTDGNMNFNFTTNSNLSDGEFKAAISTTGIVVSMHPDTVIQSLDWLNQQINEAITTANNNTPHPAGDFTITYTGSPADNPFLSSNLPAVGHYTAEDLVSTNYNIKLGSVKFTTTDTIFGGVYPSGTVGNTFGEAFTPPNSAADIDSFECIYDQTTNAFKFTMTIQGIEYAGEVDSAQNAAGKFKLTNTTGDKNDYIEMVRPKYESLVSAWATEQYAYGAGSAFDNQSFDPAQATNTTVPFVDMTTVAGVTLSDPTSTSASFDGTDWTITISDGGGTYTATVNNSHTLAGTVNFSNGLTATVPSFNAIKAAYETQAYARRPENAVSPQFNAVSGADLSIDSNPLTATPSSSSSSLGFSGTAFAMRGGTAGGPQTIADMTGISIAPNGIITGLDSVGDLIIIGRIDVVTFANAAGLNQAGSSNYTQSSNSGVPQAKQPGTDGAGKLVGGSLELSNVDLSREFSDMITTQRGYQANSRIITVSDTMLEELINLKR